MSQEGEKVVLNVYDLSQGLARQLSASLLGKVIDGIWHTGIVVYGNEYYFGGGIQRTPIGKTPYGSPLKVVDLGFTQVPKEVFEDFLNEISPRYTQATYNVLRHNCNNFTEELAQFLVGNGIPEYILGLPDEVMSSPMGGMMVPMIQSLETSLRHNQAPAVPQRIDVAGGVPNFSGIQLPPSVGVSFIQPNSVQTPLTTPKAVASPHTISAIPKSAPVENGTDKQEVAPVQADTEKVVSAIDQPKQEDLGDAKAKVHEEITREFTELMKSGSLRASEAAALAARKVMARHKIPTN